MSFFSVLARVPAIQNTATQMDILSRIDCSLWTIPSVGICEVRLMIHGAAPNRQTKTGEVENQAHLLIMQNI